MSYLIGRENLFSTISNAVVNHIKKTTAANDKMVKYASNGILSLQATDSTNPVFAGIPTNLVTNASLYADCGNSDKGEKCIECMKTFGITDDDLLGDNYLKNMDTIKSIKDNECFGSCSCNVSNVSLSSHLIFTTGVNINSRDMDTNEIYESVNKSLTTVKKDETKTDSEVNWMWLLCGLAPVPGSAVFGLAASGVFDKPTTTINMELDIKKVIANMSIMYSQTINQLITTSQEFVIKGTGIKVHNISIQSLNDITMSASLSDCNNNDDGCVYNSLNSVTNKIMNEISNNITYEVTGMIKYAFDKNKNIIIAGGSFILITLFLWFFLLFKKAASKK
jgi:hypothetical protein